MSIVARIGSITRPIQYAMSAALTRNFTTVSNRLQEPRASATLIVAAPIADHEGVSRDRDDANYRILMLKRNNRSSFVHAHVFPGGNVDEFDKDPIWADIFSGNELAKRSSTSTLAHRICAVRETFEESGILLTEPAPSPNVDLEQWRHSVHTHALNFHTFCTQYHITPAIADLVHFSQWITPFIEKRRYSTHFFLSILPADKVASRSSSSSSPTALDPAKSGQTVASADGVETIQLDWFTPHEALSAWSRGEIALFPPQWYTLLELSKVPRIEDLREHAGRGAFRRRRDGVVAMLPEFQATPEDDAFHAKGFESFAVLPGDEMCEASKGKKGDRHRFYAAWKVGRITNMALERNVDMFEEEDVQARL